MPASLNAALVPLIYLNAAFCRTFQKHSVGRENAEFSVMNQRCRPGALEKGRVSENFFIVEYERYSTMVLASKDEPAAEKAVYRLGDPIPCLTQAEPSCTQTLQGCVKLAFL